MSPTFKAWAATVVNVIPPLPKLAAEIPIDRPLTDAVPATVRPRSRKPNAVAAPGSAPPATTNVDEFGTDPTVVLMLYASGAKLFVFTALPATRPWSPAVKYVIAAVPLVFETTPLFETLPGVI